MNAEAALALAKFLAGLDGLSEQHCIFIQRGSGGFVLTWGCPGEVVAEFQAADPKSCEYGCSMLG